MADLTAFEHVLFFARVRGCARKDEKRYASELLAQVCLYVSYV